MKPDKRWCAICTGSNVTGCNFQGGSMCKPGRVPASQNIDFHTLALANGYVKLEPGRVVVKDGDVRELLHLWISHGPRFAEINRVMRAFAAAVGLVECSACNGSGTVRVPHPMKPFAPDYIDHCDDCKGTGFVPALNDSGVKA